MVSRPSSHSAVAVAADGNPPTVFDVLSEINTKLDSINDRLGKGDSAIGLLEHRVKQLETIVYAGCGIALLAVVGGLVALVVK